MKANYKVKLTPNPVIVRVQDEQEEIIYDRYIKIRTAENIVSDLNNGYKVDFDNLN